MSKAGVLLHEPESSTTGTLVHQWEGYSQVHSWSTYAFGTKVKSEKR